MRQSNHETGDPESASVTHQRESPSSISCAVLTVSDTRDMITDKSGALIIKLLQTAGHQVIKHSIVKDDPAEITQDVKEFADSGTIQAILITGGTGIAPRDQTFETLQGLITKPIPGYGELFRMLSYEEIGAAAMLSRATAGLVDRTVLMTMPGSSAAVRLAMEKLILPELGHLVSQAQKSLH